MCLVVFVTERQELNNPEGYRSGQTGQTVNLLAYAFEGSNPSLPTISRSGSCEARAADSTLGNRKRLGIGWATAGLKLRTAPRRPDLPTGIIATQGELDCQRPFLAPTGLLPPMRRRAARSGQGPQISVFQQLRAGLRAALETEKRGDPESGASSQSWHERSISLLLLFVVVGNDDHAA